MRENFSSSCVTCSFTSPWRSSFSTDILESLVLGGLRINRKSQLALDRLQFLLEEVFALALADLLIELSLDLLLDLEQLLFLFYEYEHIFHARPHIRHFEDLLLLDPVEVEDGGDEIRDLARVVDIDHGEAHLLGKKRIVFRYLLHLADQGAGHRLHLRRVEILLIDILHDDADRGAALQHALDA